MQHVSAGRAATVELRQVEWLLRELGLQIIYSVT